MKNDPRMEKIDPRNLYVFDEDVNKYARFVSNANFRAMCAEVDIPPDSLDAVATFTDIHDLGYVLPVRQFGRQDGWLVFG